MISGSKIEYLLKDSELNHSDFQIEHFIVGSQGDAWAKYKQCLREISSRYEKLRNFIENSEINRIEHENPGILKRVRGYLWRLKRKNRLKYEIIIKKREREAKRHLLELQHLERELSCFVKLACHLKENLGFIDDDKRKQLEADSWFQKARKMAAVDIMVHGGISKQTMDFILSLPKPHLKNILIELRSVKPESILQIE